MEESHKESLNFIEQMVEKELSTGKHTLIHTRFPPEPNGYLHIGHARSIIINFGVAEKYGGKCNLRFDDTNPEKEDTEYVNSIRNDIKWLGFDWEDREYYASDYFDQLFGMAVKLIKKGVAYVDDLPPEVFNKLRGTPTVPGIPSPYRERSVDENLKLFQSMKAGKFEEGYCVLRAKIDLSSPNMHMRDPILYRIKFMKHHRTGEKWCIYPTYDFAHGQSDSIEHITHSLCTLEFEAHRPLYNWFIQKLEIFPSEQTEFARLNLSYTLVSKRKLRELVEKGHVNGWDDPRMPTLSGIRRRGFTPESIRAFIKKTGISKRDGLNDVLLLEHEVREDLNKKTNRVFGILNPLKVIITNWSEDREEKLTAINNPEDETSGIRNLIFGRELYIDQSDFMEDPPSPKKWFRLGPDREVRLKYAYIIKCTGYDKDENGQIKQVYAEYDPETKSGGGKGGRKVKGTLGWVAAKHCMPVEVRLYDRLFVTENMNEIDDEIENHLNPHSLETKHRAIVEASLKNAKIGYRVQFERVGYFRVDEDSTKNHLIFNRTITLRDHWKK